LNLNSGEPWSDGDVFDLKNSLAHGDSLAQVADFLCRDVPEVRSKMKELGLVAQPRARRTKGAAAPQSSPRPPTTQS
jgi:hypothetical protein